MLAQSRANLRRYIDGDLASTFETLEECNMAAPAIHEWWSDLKKFESSDTFPNAFRSRRIVVRAMDNAKVGVQVFQPRYLPTGTAKASEQLAPAMRLNPSLAGIKARLDPHNFYDNTERFGTSQKYQLGLHNLSFSLLDPAKPINKQLKWYTDATYVFMAMPMEDDIIIFYLLNQLSKNPRVQNTFKLHVRWLSSMFTRIKFAAGEDMHTTYVDIADPGSLVAKLKYGLTGTRIHQQGVLKIDRQISVQDVENRKLAALRYKSILDAGITTVNEVVVVVRQHGVDGISQFPIFATYERDVKFNILDAHAAIGMDGEFI